MFLCKNVNEPAVIFVTDTGINLNYGNLSKQLRKKFIRAFYDGLRACFGSVHVSAPISDRKRCVKIYEVLRC